MKKRTEKKSLSKIEKAVLITAMSHVLNDMRYSKRRKCFLARNVLTVEPALYVILQGAYEKFLNQK